MGRTIKSKAVAIMYDNKANVVSKNEQKALDLSMSAYEVLGELQCYCLLCTNVLGSGDLTKCSVTYKLLQEICYSWAAYKRRFFCGGVIN